MWQKFGFNTSFFYQRMEDEQKVEITLLGLPFLHILFWFVIFISLLSLGKYTTVAFFAFCFSVLIYLGLSWRVFVEIRQAMLMGGILVQGSQLSMRNPLRIIIEK